MIQTLSDQTPRTRIQIIAPVFARYTYSSDAVNSIFTGKTGWQRCHVRGCCFCVILVLAELHVRNSSIFCSLCNPSHPIFKSKKRAAFYNETAKLPKKCPAAAETRVRLGFLFRQEGINGQTSRTSIDSIGQVHSSVTCATSQTTSLRSGGLFVFLFL